MYFINTGCVLKVGRIFTCKTSGHCSDLSTIYNTASIPIAVTRTGWASATGCSGNGTISIRGGEVHTHGKGDQVPLTTPMSTAAPWQQQQRQSLPPTIFAPTPRLQQLLQQPGTHHLVSNAQPGNHILLPSTSGWNAPLEAVEGIYRLLPDLITHETSHDNIRYTPLYFACHRASSKVAEFLLRKTPQCTAVLDLDEQLPFHADVGELRLWLIVELMLIVWSDSLYTKKSKHDTRLQQYVWLWWMDVRYRKLNHNRNRNDDNDKDNAENSPFGAQYKFDHDNAGVRRQNFVFVWGMNAKVSVDVNSSDMLMFILQRICICQKSTTATTSTIAGTPPTTSTSTGLPPE